jgi:hypothetical protein
MVAIAQKLLPTLDIASACEVNLNQAAVEWLLHRGSPPGNPLLDPQEAQEMIDWVHRAQGVAWSYGSYLEDRSEFLKESYLDETGGYIHLGVDVNVAPGTVVAAPFDALVEDVFDDGDTPQGWGPRLILRPFDVRIPYLILGHLTSLSGYRAGDKVRAGDELAHVAPAPYNGYWFPHLHVQLLSRVAAKAHQTDRYESLDGYGHRRDLPLLVQSYPDPTWLVVPEASALRRDLVFSREMIAEIES